MESKRCTSLTVLLVLIALETILVDFVCTACDHSKPSGDWVNDYDGLVDYDCGTGKLTETEKYPLFKDLETTVQTFYIPL